MSPATGVPWRPLVVITGAVLCIHVLALRGAPESLQWTHTILPFVVSVREAPAPAPSPQRASIASAAPELAPRTRQPAAAPARSMASASRAASTATALAALSIPAPATWRYAATAQWRGMTVAGDAALAWRHDDSTYEASLVLEVPSQARTQRSTGEFGTDGLRPLRFSERLRSEEATHFDREQGRITFSSNRPDVALRAGAQDRLSLLVQLMAAVAANPDRFVPGASTALQVATTRGADEWQFTVEGTEVLVLPAGPLPALKLTRQPRGDYDVRLELWLAPGQAYAPVRLRLTPPNGDWLDLQWSGTDKR
jgi:hypothetical protein